MADHLYERDGDRYVPSALTTGFWDPDLQAGGPAGALLAHAMERFEPGWSDAEGALVLVRATIELTRPVPKRPLTVVVRAERAGRRIQRLVASLRDEGTEVGRASGLRLTPVPVRLPDGVEAFEHPQPPGPEAPWRRIQVVPPPWPTIDAACDLRQVEGPEELLGPSAVWVRLTSDFIAGLGTTPLNRTVLAADWVAGLGGALPIDQYVRPNADLNLHVRRYPEGEWVGVRGQVLFSGTGNALGDATLHDAGGTLGRATASVIISAR
jgi:hypothetical protein